MEKFRVLVVDDKDIVLNSFRNTISPVFEINKTKYECELTTVHVNVIGDDQREEYHIADSTILDLADKCAKPFDLILLDYGYRMERSDIIERVFIREGTNFSLKSLNGKLLNPNDLIQQCNEYANRNDNKYIMANIGKNFIDHKGKIYLYTYTPLIRKHYLPSSQFRETITINLFKKASEIEVLDTRVLLFNDDQFVDKYDDHYYSYLISVYLNSIIKIELLNKIDKKNKYIKVSKTSKALGFIVIIAGSYGATSEFLGGTIVSLLEKQNYILATVLLILFVVSIIIGSTLLIHFFENRFSKLFEIE